MFIACFGGLACVSKSEWLGLYYVWPVACASGREVVGCCAVSYRSDDWVGPGIPPLLPLL